MPVLAKVAETRRAKVAEARRQIARMLDLSAAPKSAGSEAFQSAMRVHEQTSEQLVSLAQLAFGFVFGALYLFSPRPSDGLASMMQPVPLILFWYFVLTLGRLFYTLRWRMTPLLLAVSIVADVALLVVLAWTYHMQYGQQAAFSLKVPTFLYLFVLVALRALRFDARLVLFAGLAGALGWATLTAIAVFDQGTGAITHSFVAYLSSDSILLGAEIEKILVLLAVSGILALTIHRSRAMLVKAATEEISGREVSRFLSRGLVDTIRQAKTPFVAGQAEHRNVSIIMLDIRSFTPFAAAAGPARTVEVLTRLHDLVLPITWRHGGVVDKFLGDGIMLTFGAIEPMPDAARRGLTAFIEIMRETADWETAEGLKVNGAATFGEVVFATLGTADRLEYTVIGEPVNDAAKLEQHNKVAGTRGLVTWHLVEAADQQGEPAIWPLADLGACTVAGITGGMNLRRVVDRG